MNKRPQDMTIDELFAIGNQQRENNYASGMSTEGVEFLTHSWIVGLETYQGVSRAVGDALRQRWMIYDACGVNGPYCQCQKVCGDVSEDADHPNAICKLLPRA